MNLAEPLLGLAVTDKAPPAPAPAPAKEGGEGPEAIGKETAGKKTRRTSLFRMSGPTKVEALPFPTKTATTWGQGTGGRSLKVEWTDEDADDDDRDGNKINENIAGSVGSDTFPVMNPTGGGGGGGEERDPATVSASGGGGGPATATARPTTTVTGLTATMDHPLLSPLTVPRSTTSAAASGGGGGPPGGAEEEAGRRFGGGGFRRTESGRAAGAPNDSAATAAAASAGAAGGPPRGRGGGGGVGGHGGGREGAFVRGMSSRFFNPVRADMKPTEVFAEPLVSEGEGSVFPIDLPPSRRRALETDFIRKFDRLAVNPNVGEFWMLIDAGWVAKWCSFVLGLAGSPGPISNRRLLGENVLTPLPSPVSRVNTPGRRRSARSDDGMGTTPIATPRAMATAAAAAAAAAAAEEGGAAPVMTLRAKPGLQAVKDYRAVHPLVWFIFREIYNTDGTPDICRWKLDLYAQEVSVERRERILEPAHTKAIYQLRRFVARIKRDMEDEKNKTAQQERKNSERMAERKETLSKYRRFKARRSQQARVGSG
ncbi:unnamed protein product [Pylaiella littoralis]